MVYPITAHCMNHQHDEDGGFVVEATTIQDPIGFATTLCDETGPLWGPPLVEAVRKFRHWAGLLAMVNDDNTGAVALDEDGGEQLRRDFEPHELERMDAALAFWRSVLEAAGASQVSGPASPRRTCRAGAAWATTRALGRRRGRRVTGREAAVRRRRSVIPRTLSVNPSLTIMALATGSPSTSTATRGYLGRAA